MTTHSYSTKLVAGFLLMVFPGCSEDAGSDGPLGSGGASHDAAADAGAETGGGGAGGGAQQEDSGKPDGETAETGGDGGGPALECSVEVTADFATARPCTDPAPSIDGGSKHPVGDAAPETADVIEEEGGEAGSPETMPTAFEIGQSIGGTLAISTAGSQDRDYFSAHVTGGTVIEIELAYAAPSLDLDIQFLGCRLGGGVERSQCFVAEDADAAMSVLDSAAAADPDETLPDGGADGHYVIQTRAISPTPMRGDLATEVCVEPNGNVDIYRYVAPEDWLLVAEPLPGTNFLLYDPEGGVVASNEDQTQFPVSPCHEYWWVVEKDGSNPGERHELVVTTSQQDEATPRELRLGEALTGVIGAIDGKDFDSDFFRVTGDGPIRVEVTAMTDNLRPTLSGHAGDQSKDTLGPARADGRVAAMEIGGPRLPDTEDGSLSWIVRLDDARNVLDDASQDVGGAGLGYTIRATSATWTEASVTAPVDTTADVALGGFAWFEMDQPAGTIAYVTASATNGTPAVTTRTKPQEDASHCLDGAATFANIGAEAADTTLEFGVREASYLATEMHVAAVLFDLADAKAPVAEIEPNNALAQAQTVRHGTAIAGATSASGPWDLQEDMYAVELLAGQTLMVRYDFGDDPPVATRIYDNGGTFATDCTHGPETFIYTATIDATYFVEVTPKQCDENECANGEYIATFLVE